MGNTKEQIICSIGRSHNKPLKPLTSFAGTHTRRAALPFCPTCLRPLLKSYVFNLKGPVMDEISREVSNLESLLRLPSGFYNSLMAEDDWSFVIKLSALFEAASGQALAAKLQHSEIESELSYLEQVKKINLILKLNIITKEQSKFLIDLASLRNTLVHNISNVTFSWETYTSKLDKNQKKSFAKVFGQGVHEKFEINDVSLNRTDFTVENPKMAIWVTAQEILACLHADIENSSNIRKINEIGQKLVQNITNQLSAD